MGLIFRDKWGWGQNIAEAGEDGKPISVLVQHCNATNWWNLIGVLIQTV